MLGSRTGRKYAIPVNLGNLLKITIFTKIVKIVIFGIFGLEIPAKMVKMHDFYEK